MPLPDAADTTRHDETVKDNSDCDVEAVVQLAQLAGNVPTANPAIACIDPATKPTPSTSYRLQILIYGDTEVNQGLGIVGIK